MALGVRQRGGPPAAVVRHAAAVDVGRGAGSAGGVRRCRVEAVTQRRHRRSARARRRRPRADHGHDLPATARSADPRACTSAQPIVAGVPRRSTARSARALRSSAFTTGSSRPRPAPGPASSRSLASALAHWLLTVPTEHPSSWRSRPRCGPRGSAAPRRPAAARGSRPIATHRSCPSTGSCAATGEPFRQVRGRRLARPRAGATTRPRWSPGPGGRRPPGHLDPAPGEPGLGQRGLQQVLGQLLVLHQQVRRAQQCLRARDDEASNSAASAMPSRPSGRGARLGVRRRSPRRVWDREKVASSPRVLLIAVGYDNASGRSRPARRLGELAAAVRTAASAPLAYAGSRRPARRPA